MTSSNTAVVVGIGELGGVFARGLLRCGTTVVPVLRNTDPAAVARAVPEPAVVLVTVGESDLHGVLASTPEPWRGALALVQNELLPRDWNAHGPAQPTVAVVWFEKKPGADSKVVLPTPVFGPAARSLLDALAAVNLPARELADEAALRYELVRKNLYILTLNIAGLAFGGASGGTVRELRAEHEPLWRAVAGEVLAVQQHLVGEPLDHDRLIAGLEEAFDADPDHKCRGRTAPARLERALGHASRASLDVPELRAIARGAAQT